MSLFSPFHRRKSLSQSKTSGSGQFRQPIGASKNLRVYWEKVGGVAIGTILVLQPTLAQAQIQRSFINPSFEQPTFGATNQQCYVQVSPGIVPGWETTHGSVAAGTGSCTGYTSPGTVPLIEVWTSGFGGASTATGAGNQFAELNAEQASQLYQNLCLYNGETITFSLLHRGRSSATTADVANFLIGLNTDPSPTVFGRFSTTSNGTVTAQPVALNGATIPTVTNNNAGNGWVRYNGTVPYAGATGNRPVGFAAVSTAGGNNTIGNFLDDVQFAGKPVLEFVTSSGGGPESETAPTTNPPKIRVVGLVPAGGVNVPISVSGTAVLGTDFTTPSGAATFNMLIPAGNYDGSNSTSLFTIPFTVINNNIPQGVRTIVFTIQPSSNFFASSTMTCGGSPIVTSSYTINDDDFISGKVWNDADNSANNTFTNINTGSETGTNAGGQLYAILVNAANTVLRTTAVAADGTYTFSDVPFNQNSVRIILSTTAGTVGNTAPTPALPSNWVNTSPLTTAAFNTGTNIANQDFGIEQLPNTNPISASSQTNPGGTNTVQVPTLSGTDPEDGALGSGNSFKIVTVPTNGTLYYNGSAVAAGQIISNYDPTRLTIDPNNGALTVSFTYAAIDAAGKEDLTPATVTMPFTLPVTISGTVFHDHSANVVLDNDLSTDVGTNASSSSLTVYAINATGQVVDKVTVAANGTYTLTNVPANSTVTLRLSNDNSVAIGATAPAVGLPSNWYYTGENVNGTIDAEIATLGNIAVTTTTSNLTNHNFGIRQGYTIAPDPAPTVCNPDYQGALNTGISSAGGQLPVGSLDLNWSVEWLNASIGAISYATARPVGPMPAVVVGNLAPGAWVSEPSNARWISYPFRLSSNSNGDHRNADLDGSGNEIAVSGSYTGTSDTIRLKYTASVTLPANAQTITVSLPIGVSVDNQFASVKVNGVENLTPTPTQDPQTEDYRATRTVTMSQGWQAGVNTIEIITDSGPPLTGFFLKVEATTTQTCGTSNLLLVKRITAINGNRTSNPNDSTPLNQVVDDTTSTRQADDNNPNWASNYLVGAIDAGKVKPGDEVEYTIYWLNSGNIPLNAARVCDRITANQTFQPNQYGSGQGMQLQVGNGTIATVTNADDASSNQDRVQFISAGDAVPGNCNLKAANDNGTIVLDLVGSNGTPNLPNLPAATAPGTPTSSYGFIRFTTKINP